MATDSETPDPASIGNVDHPFPSEAAVISIRDQVLATIKEIDLAAIVETLFGPMPGGQFVMVPITGMIIHSWDIAKATGTNTTLDAGLAELGYNILVNVAERGRANRAFRPEVTVPASASFQDWMSGLSGRQP